MKKILFFLLIINIFSCAKDEIEKQRGTKLISIKQLDSGVETFFVYDDQDKIIRAEWGNPSYHQLDFLYDDNNRLRRINNNSNIVYIDSFSYNMDDQLEKVQIFRVDSLGNPYLVLIHEYIYLEDKVAARRNYDIEHEYYNTTEKYIWKGKNIKEIKKYDRFGNLVYEEELLYDNKCNYMKNNPLYIKDPRNWTANNINEYVYDDFGSNIDVTCSPPCPVQTFQYTYNKDGYPVKISYNDKFPIVLRYE